MKFCSVKGGAGGTKRVSGGGNPNTGDRDTRRIGAAKKGKTGQRGEDPFHQNWHNTRINKDDHILVSKYQSKTYTLCGQSSTHAARLEFCCVIMFEFVTISNLSYC